MSMVLILRASHWNPRAKERDGSFLRLGHREPRFDESRESLLGVLPVSFLMRGSRPYYRGSEGDRG